MAKVFFLLAALAIPVANGGDRTLNPEIAGYVNDRIAEFDRIPDDRQKQLEEIAHYVGSRIRVGEPARLTFICTHNSRRSHICQIWAQTAAAYYGIPVETFSGGTEATAFNPRAIATLKRAGFDISNPDSSENPHYQVRFDTGGEPMECFSKVYDDAHNPTVNFCVVMTCSEADKNCSNIAGASLRVAVPYDDPKVADNTPEESARYDQRCAQIAREMLFVFSRVKP